MDFSGPSSSSQYFRIYFISPVVLFKVAKPCLAPTMISLLEPWIFAVTLHRVRGIVKQVTGRTSASDLSHSVFGLDLLQ